jgi:assimilatory nitrate reductase catalytic subunit
MFADGGFFTPNRRARLVAIDTPSIPAGSTSHPLILNTGRMRDQWHTMTRTGLSPRLASHRPEPALAVNPADAAAFGLADGGLARVASAHGSAVLRVAFDSGQARGTVFAPIHWNDEIAGDARVGAVVHPLTDPHSGQPDAKATSVTMSPVAGEPGGFILSRKRLRLPGVAFWAWCAVEGGFATHLDGPFDPGPVLAALRSSVPGSDVARYRDEAADVTRAALLLDDRLEAVFFSGAGAPGGWTGLMRLWAAEKLSALDRLLILSGESGEGVPQTGPIVCACFGVGETAINEAITAGACDIADIGRTLKAGTNCGSCLPELKKMLKARHAEHAS